MEAVIFWIGWGLISFWALKSFYYSFSKEKLEHLRKANIGFTIALFILYFLPWVPLSLAGGSGFGLARGGNLLAILFFILLFITLILFLRKKYIYLKIASVLTFLSTLDLFVLMLIVRPGTFTLTLYDIAPIIAFLVLLCQIGAVLLLWQQMQLAPKADAESDKRKKLIIAVFSILIAVLGLLLSFYGHSSQNKVPKVSENKKVEQKGFEAFAQKDSGLVCSGNSSFSFQIDTPYKILSEDKDGIAIFVSNSLLTVSKDQKNIIDTFKKFGITYKKEGEVYFYETPANKSGAIDGSKNYGMSQERNRFLVSVFSSKEDDKEAKKMLSNVIDSLKEGCTK